MLEIDVNITLGSENELTNSYVNLDLNYVKRNSYSELKITCLNVNGVHSKAKLGIFELFMQDSDLICLSATKCSRLEKNLFPGYSPLKDKNDIAHP